jgi:hypothetical protein
MQVAAATMAAGFFRLIMNDPSPLAPRDFCKKQAIWRTLAAASPLLSPFSA